VAIAAAIVVAWLVIDKLPGWIATMPDHVAEAAPEPIAATAAEPLNGPVASTSPQLLIGAATPAAVDDPIPLGISLINAGHNDAVIVRGVPTGSNITNGRPFGPNGWLLLGFELGNAAIRPARGFVGGADLVVELRHGTQIVDRRPVHFEWAGAPTRSLAVAAAAAAAPSASTRRLAPEEVAVLVRRGEDLVASGDLAAARLLLQRAAESGDPRGALALAATYDPLVLEQMRTQGIAADASLARSWYEKAKQFGSAEASRRLEVLAASRDH
jgi:hypothetical protein